MTITKCKELVLSEITIEFEDGENSITTDYTRLEDKEGNVNWDYTFSSDPIAPEEMEELEEEYQNYIGKKLFYGKRGINT